MYPVAAGCKDVRKHIHAPDIFAEISALCLGELLYIAEPRQSLGVVGKPAEGLENCKVNEQYSSCEKCKAHRKHDIHCKLYALKDAVGAGVLYKACELFVFAVDTANRAPFVNGGIKHAVTVMQRDKDYALGNAAAVGLFPLLSPICDYLLGRSFAFSGSVGYLAVYSVYGDVEAFQLLVHDFSEADIEADNKSCEYRGHYHKCAYKLFHGLSPNL